MRNLRKLIYLAPAFALLFLNLPAKTEAAEFHNDPSTTITNAVNQDLFSAGSDFSLAAPVTGETYVASKTIELKDTPSRSAYLIGSSVTVNKGVGYNLFAAGSTVTLSGTYGNDVYVVADKLIINSDTVINGDLWTDSTTITLAGTVKGSVHAQANTMTSSAIIAKDVTGGYLGLTFTGGSIGGSLSYHSSVDATGLNTVKVTGTTARSEFPTRSGAQILIDALLAIVMAFLFGTLLAARFPRRVEQLTKSVTVNYAANLGYGLLALLIVPFIAIALAATVVGMKIAIFIVLLYILFILMAGIIRAFVLGRYVLTQIAPQHAEHIWYQLITGVLLGYLIVIVPYIGIPIGILLLILTGLPTFGALIRFAITKD